MSYERRTKIIILILLSLIIVGVVCFCSGCSILEIKQEHYRKDFGKLPQKEQISIESVGAISVGATEINKGLNWIYYNGSEALDKRVEILLDFSYNVMGFLGVAWESIDWNDPEKFFDQAKKQQEAMNHALKEKETKILKLEKDVQDHLVNLANKDDVIKDKDAEMQSRDGKWSAKLTWVWSLIKWGIFLVLFLGAGWWIYTGIIKLFAGLPFKAAFFGSKVVAKMGKQVVHGIQKAKLELLEKGHKESIDILHKNLSSSENEEVQELIDSIKDKHKMKRVSND